MRADGSIIRRIVGGASAARFGIGAFVLAKERIAWISSPSALFSVSVGSRREKAGEIPARRILLHVEPLVEEVGVIGAGADEIAAERIDEPPAD